MAGFGDKIKGAAGEEGSKGEEEKGPSKLEKTSNFAEEYKKTFFGEGGGGGGRVREGPPMSQIIIFLAIYIVVAVVIFMIFGPIGGAIAGLVGFFLFLAVSGLGQRIVQSKHFLAIAGMFILIGIVIFVIYFYTVGGFQATSGLSYQTSQGFSAILTLPFIKGAINWAQNPFGLNPTAGTYEELPPAETPAAGPNQAFTLETRGFTSSVAFEQQALSFFVKISNNGAQKISKMDLSLNSGNHPGCIVFDISNMKQEYPDADVKQAGPNEKGEYGPLKFTVKDISAQSSREIAITGGKIDTKCMKNDFGARFEFRPNAAPMDVFVTVKGMTYYSTSSRLAVERINTSYGELLFKNDLLTQEKVGATYQAGTALSINLDIGDQPILDTVTSGGLLMNWINNGAGKMSSNEPPILFIATPWDFGQCRMNVLNEAKGSDCNSIDNLANPKTKINCMLCDADLYDAWCGPAGNIFNTIITPYSASSAAMFNWACQYVNSSSPQYKTAHVCATNVLTEEFNVFNCNLSMSSAKIPSGEDRHTEYITAVAVYPYEVTAPDVDVKTYCTEPGTTGQCPT